MQRYKLLSIQRNISLAKCGYGGQRGVPRKNPGAPKKELIDPAVIRTGRMDLHVEICPPDKTTRKKMFDLYLKDRPCIGIDTDMLADKTDNYASSDIAFIVNDAALVAAFKDSPIDQAMLEESIKKRPSSLGKKQEERRKIGF